METNTTKQPFLISMARRVIIWGPTIAAFLGLVAAFNAMLGDEYVGAGVCLIASAMAFGVLAYASRK